MILVDDRVGSIELLPELSRLGYHVQSQRLDAGDFSFPGEGPNGPCLIGIERKRLGDLVQSLKSGRLVGHQAIQMRQQYDYCYLLIEGVYRVNEYNQVEIPIGRSRWSSISRGRGSFLLYSDLSKWLTGFELGSGFFLRRSAHLQESALLIGSLADYWSKPWDEHRTMNQFHSGQVLRGVGLEAPSLVRRVAKELDGIGWEKSKAVEAVFGTVMDMVDGGVKDWMKVEGIGKKIAERVVRDLRGLKRDK